MAYKEETIKIIEEMKVKEGNPNSCKAIDIRHTATNEGMMPTNMKDIQVTKEWAAQRVGDLYGIVHVPGYLNTVPNKLGHTIREAKKLLKGNGSKIEMVRWNVAEYESLIKTILNYAEVTKDGTIKVNRQEWLSAMNTVLIAYSAMHGLEKTTIEAHLQRESSKSVDYNGRKNMRSSDEPRRVRTMPQGGLKSQD